MIIQTLITLVIASSFTHAQVTTKDTLAINAIKDLGTTLKKELKKSLKVSPEHALKSCNIKAMKLTTEMKQKHNIEIGRVSLKNRNSNNYPKNWMLKYINQFHSQKINKKVLIVDLKNGKKGLLKPITTAPLCLTCHGSNIATSVKRKISDLYPKDKATKYKVGEIRGFFFAEY